MEENVYPFIDLVGSSPISWEKAAENANVLVEGTLTEERKTLFTLFDKGIKGVVERKVTVDIESITNEQNITLL